MTIRTTQDNRVYGGIEAGGTKWVCAIGSGPDDVIAETRFPTTTPTETLARAIAFFQDHQHLGPLAAIGVGAFGPVDLDPRSATYGYITSTPKQDWANTNVAWQLGRLRRTVVRVSRFERSDTIPTWTSILSTVSVVSVEVARSLL
jgi:predicted NBD/HSP70 family sugar kinase